LLARVRDHDLRRTDGPDGSRHIEASGIRVSQKERCVQDADAAITAGQDESVQGCRWVADRARGAHAADKARLSLERPDRQYALWTYDAQAPDEGVLGVVSRQNHQASPLGGGEREEGGKLGGGLYGVGRPIDRRCGFDGRTPTGPTLEICHLERAEAGRHLGITHAHQERRVIVIVEPQRTHEAGVRHQHL